MGIRNTWLLPVALCAGCATAIAPDPTGGPGPGSPDAQGSSPTGGCSFSGTLATWSFAGQPGTESSIAPTSTAGGATASDVTRAATLTATSGTDSLNSSGWPTSAQVATSKYYALSLTPPSGCTLDLGSIAIDAKSSSTGPAHAAVATSADGFAQTTTVSTSGASTPALSVTGMSAPVEIRIYGFAAAGTPGTMRLQNTLTVTGSLH
jgi:hypothetical protein